MLQLCRSGAACVTSLLSLSDLQIGQPRVPIPVLPSHQHGEDAHKVLNKAAKRPAEEVCGTVARYDAVCKLAADVTGWTLAVVDKFTDAMQMGKVLQAAQLLAAVRARELPAASIERKVSTIL